MSPQQLLVAGKFMIAGDNFLIVKNDKGEYECIPYDGNQEKMRTYKNAFFGDMHNRRITPIDNYTLNNYAHERKVRTGMEILYGEKYVYSKCREKRPDRKKVRAHVQTSGQRHRVLYNRHFPNHVTVAVVGYTTE